jgi:competence protein ComEC
MAFCLLLWKKRIHQGNRFVGLLKTTLFLNLCLLPVLVESSGGVGLLFPLANLVFISFLTFVFLPLSFVTLFFPIVSDVYFYAIEAFETSVMWFVSLNPFVSFNFPSVFAKLVFAATVFVVLCFGNKRWAKPFALILLLVSITSSLVKLPGVEKVTVFAIGQGDAILIYDQQTTILIDTGPSDKYDTLVNYLLKENIYLIDLLVITHWHSDHYGELDDLVGNFSVNTIVAPSTNDLYHDLQIDIPKQNDTIKCGNFSFIVLNAHNNSENENNNSLVLYGKIGVDSWLFLGDAENEVESQLEKLSLEVDIVKVGHHGSETSSDRTFIDWCDPDYALISVGKNNYGLPNGEVVANWQEQAKVLITATDGTIQIAYYPIIDYRHISTYRADGFQHFH